MSRRKVSCVQNSKLAETAFGIDLNPSPPILNFERTTSLEESLRMASSMDLVIGVDGGGTKTVAWLAPLSDDGTGQVLGRGRAGPGNPRAAGFEVAQASIDAAIEAAFADANVPRGPVAAASLCLSGAGRPAEQSRLTQWADARSLAKITRVTGDAEPILAAASSENWGIALIAGTGSLAWGRNRAGDVARSGGWGYLIGDEGSAYAIALAGLRAATQAADGRGPATELLSRFQQQLAAAAPQDLIERIYGSDMTRERIALLAIVVFDAAANDLVAQQIVDTAATDLADMAAALVQSLNLPVGEYPLALAGSVLEQQETLRQRVLARLHQTATEPGEVRIVSEPVCGAITLARIAASNEFISDHRL